MTSFTMFLSRASFVTACAAAERGKIEPAAKMIDATTAGRRQLQPKRSFFILTVKRNSRKKVKAIPGRPTARPAPPAKSGGTVRGPARLRRRAREWPRPDFARGRHEERKCVR